MATTSANGIELYFDRFGNPNDPSLLLVSGLGAQCLVYEDEFCEQIAANNRYVIRYDNRDVGLSTHLHADSVDVMSALIAASSGEQVDAPYTLSDMAADGMGLLDSLGIERADIFGASMGGMISQTMAIEHPERVRSLTSLMSTTGEVEVGTPDPETLTALLSVMVPQVDREERIQSSVHVSRVIGTQRLFNTERATERAGVAVDRAYDPEGTARQLVAIFASGSRADGLAQLSLPTVVMHGNEDPLVNISGGLRTAELVPKAEFRMLEGMGHDMPLDYWDRIIEGITASAERATL
jgi:pimeloyl-ACP methyl ester carboxylesterase